MQNIDRIIDEKGTLKRNLIPILQAIQKEYNYLPEEALRYLSEKTSITSSEIIGVASFYKQFRMHPAGKHLLKICVGTACHVKGAGLVYDAFRRHFDLPEGADTDKSGSFTLEKVSCLGCCTLAPVVQIDNITYGHVAPDQVDKVIQDFESQKNRKDKKIFRKSDGSEIKGE
ncbi:MAG: NAD(P)H-dependent oxidoreductase subunit E, partial [Prolixibacteraceae bacterium]|nr:NAD(P)H-dependent oxidoreductase subunit E [Prolixibacteraceae bacterium]